MRALNKTLSAVGAVGVLKRHWVVLAFWAVLLVGVACGGLAMASDHYVCCEQATGELNVASTGTCAWDACPATKPGNSFVYLYSAQKQGSVRVSLKGQEPGACFGPPGADSCFVVDATSDFVQDRAPVLEVDSALMTTYGVSTYEECWSMVGSCPAGTAATPYADRCCTASTPVPTPMPPGASWVQVDVPSAMPVTVQPQAFFGLVGVAAPALGGRGAVLLFASMGVLGLVVVGKRRKAA